MLFRSVANQLLTSILVRCKTFNFEFLMKSKNTCSLILDRLIQLNDRCLSAVNFNRASQKLGSQMSGTNPRQSFCMRFQLAMSKSTSAKSFCHIPLSVSDLSFLRYFGNFIWVSELFWSCSCTKVTSSSSIQLSLLNEPFKISMLVFLTAFSAVILSFFKALSLPRTIKII